MFIMSKKKFYVVWSGHQPGIFDSWAACKAAVHKFHGARFKSFETLAEAKNAFQGNYTDYTNRALQPKLSKISYDSGSNPILDSIAVDAASSGNPGKMEYQGVDTSTKKLLFHQGPFAYCTNNVGEFLALVHGLAYLKKNDSKRALYSDSKIAIHWLQQKKCKTKLQQNRKNKAVFELIRRAEHWLLTNTFSTRVLKWETKIWGEIPADFGRK